MGWLRRVGSLESQVSFAEYRLFYRALLQKNPTILRSLLIVATPYDISGHTLQHTLQHTLKQTLQHTLQHINNELEWNII